MEWQTNILTIPVAQPGQAPAIDCPLLTQYGPIFFEDIRAHALTYVRANAREAQHNMMCYNCIMMSLSENGQKITSEHQTYHVNKDCLFPSCAILFKVLMNMALVDNRKTTTM